MVAASSPFDLSGASTDNASPAFAEPTSAKWMKLIGLVLGGASGKGLGGTLMGLGNLVDKNAYSQWEQANRPKELQIFQKHFNWSPQEMNYYQGLPTEVYDQLKPRFYAHLFDKPPHEAPIKVTKDGMTGLYDPSAGTTQWLPSGEAFYQPPEKSKQPSPLTQEQLGVATAAGLSPDPSKWGASDWSRYMKAAGAYARSKQQPPQVPEMLIPGVDANGTPVIGGVERPRGGGSPNVLPPTPLGFTPTALRTRPDNKSKKTPQDIIDAEMATAQRQWLNYQRYKSSTASGWQKLLGIPLDNPNTYSKRVAAIKLNGMNLLPPDIQSIDPNAKFIGRFDKLGNPIYQTSKGLMASESFGG